MYNLTGRTCYLFRGTKPTDPGSIGFDFCAKLKEKEVRPLDGRVILQGRTVSIGALVAITAQKLLIDAAGDIDLSATNIQGFK